LKYIVTTVLTRKLKMGYIKRTGTTE